MLETPEQRALITEALNNVIKTSQEHPGDGLRAVCAALNLAVLSVNIYSEPPTNDETKT